MIKTIKNNTINNINMLLYSSLNSPVPGKKFIQINEPIHMDQSFNINLKANPQNGYLWYVDNISNNIISESNYTIETLPMYRGAIQQFSFKSIIPGTCQIQFIYKRSWENIPYAIKIIEILVV
jgi:predicted secreted protein